jgi:hypothetical protein
LRTGETTAVTKRQQAIRELSRAMHDRTGNLPPLALQRPLSDDSLVIVSRGEKKDEGRIPG